MVDNSCQFEGDFKYGKKDRSVQSETNAATEENFWTRSENNHMGSGTYSKKGLKKYASTGLPGYERLRKVWLLILLIY